jgi:hypothetical protein
MSEKRLIDFDDLMRISFNSESSHDVAEEFDKLPTPTLTDVTGTRKLDSMTDEEIKELIELYAGGSVYIKLALRDNDKSIYVEYLKYGHRSTLHIYLGELSVGGKEIKIFKWFIKKGFNVLGDIE